MSPSLKVGRAGAFTVIGRNVSYQELELEAEIIPIRPDIDFRYVRISGLLANLSGTAQIITLRLIYTI